jgi:hypothetical protein
MPRALSGSQGQQHHLTHLGFEGVPEYRIPLGEVLQLPLELRLKSSLPFDGFILGGANRITP